MPAQRMNVRRTHEQRLALFWQKVRKGPKCWIWTGSRTYGRDGIPYGCFWDGKAVRAHRWIYEQEVGPVPRWLPIDHTCDTRLCVRTAHMRVSTHRENILRGVGFTAVNAAKTHCPRGHVYDLDNTAYYRWSRHCRECWRLRAARRYAASKRLRGEKEKQA